MLKAEFWFWLGLLFLVKKKKKKKIAVLEDLLIMQVAYV
jgi:hypothetical protein